MLLLRHWAYQIELAAAYLKVEVKQLVVNDLRPSVHAALGRHEARRRRARQEPICLRACTHPY